MYKRLYVSLCISFVLFIVGIFFYTGQKTLPKQPITKNNKTITVSQYIVINTTNPHEQDIEIEEGQTALTLLTKTNKTEMTGTGRNAFITSINNRIADKRKHEFWAFYVNGKQAQVGAGSYVLHQGDKIEWKIETY